MDFLSHREIGIPAFVVGRYRLPHAQITDFNTLTTAPEKLQIGVTSVRLKASLNPPPCFVALNEQVKGIAIHGNAPGFSGCRDETWRTTSGRRPVRQSCNSSSPRRRRLPGCTSATRSSTLPNIDMCLCRRWRGFDSRAAPTPCRGPRRISKGLCCFIACLLVRPVLLHLVSRTLCLRLLCFRHGKNFKKHAKKTRRQQAIRPERSRQCLPVGTVSGTVTPGHRAMNERGNRRNCRQSFRQRKGGGCSGTPSHWTRLTWQAPITTRRSRSLGRICSGFFPVMAPWMRTATDTCCSGEYRVAGGHDQGANLRARGRAKVGEARHPFRRAGAGELAKGAWRQPAGPVRSKGRGPLTQSLPQPVAHLPAQGAGLGVASPPHPHRNARRLLNSRDTLSPNPPDLPAAVVRVLNAVESKPYYDWQVQELAALPASVTPGCERCSSPCSTRISIVSCSAAAWSTLKCCLRIPGCPSSRSPSKWTFE